MPTTTKMGIVYPSSTDLVKDGATAMGTISTTVDAKSGLVLLNTTSFSAVASQSINDVFSTNFDNYKILYTCTTSTENTVNLRLRVSGADNTTSNYYRQLNLAKDTSVSATENLAATSFNGFNTNTTITPINVEVFSPFLSTATAFLGQYHKVETLATVHENGFVTGLHNVASSFTGFTFTVGGGTMSGTISVFGYNKG